MGLLDVRARSWQAPSRQEQAQKAELYRLEEKQDQNKRQLENQLDMLHKVQDVKHDNMVANSKLLAADARHRRAVSGAGLGERERLALLEAERESRLLRAAGASSHLGAHHSPLLVPHSPAALGVSVGHPTGLAVPASRLRTVSAHGGPTMLSSPHSLGVPLGAREAAALAHARDRQREAALLSAAGATPRMRSLSNVGLGSPSPMAMEKLRLEERKAALLAREAGLQHAREDRLRAKKSQIELADAERRLRNRERELEDRRFLNNRDAALDREEAHLRAVEREGALEDEIGRRMRKLSMNSPLLGTPHLDDGLGGHNLLSPSLAVPSGLGHGHSRSRSLGGLSSPMINSPLLAGGGAGLSPRLGAIGSGGYGAHLDDMQYEAARLGIPLPSGSALSLSGASPRMAAFPDSGLGTFSHSHGRRGQDLGGLDDFDLDNTAYGSNIVGGLGSRSRRGSLASIRSGNAGLGMDELDAYRMRRDSQPFEETALFDTRGYY